MDGTGGQLSGHPLDSFRAEELDTPEKLPPAEQKVLEAVRIRAWKECEITATLPAGRTKENAVRAGFIRFLVLEGDGRSFVHEKGLQLTGACIQGELDFHGCEIKRPLFLTNCIFENSLILRDARTSTVKLDGSSIVNIDGQRAKVAGSLYLHKCSVSSGINLIDADIGGSLECHSVQFRRTEGRLTALYASRAKVGGSVFLHQGFRAESEVSFRGAVIRGNLDCSNGSFNNPDGSALSCDGAAIAGNVFMSRGFSAYGEVDFVGAEIRGNFLCDGGRFEKGSSAGPAHRQLAGTALSATRARIEGSVYLRRIADGSVPATKADFVARGEINFIDAKIGGSFECHGGKFLNRGGTALYCSRISVAGSVFLHKHFTAAGEVIFRSAEIGGNLEVTDAHFRLQGLSAAPGREPKSLCCERARVKGSVFLKRTSAKHQIDFIDAHIGGSLECHGAKFISQGPTALHCSRARFGGSVFLHEKFEASGGVVFRRASIGGNLECDTGTFRGIDVPALNCEGAKILGNVLMGNQFNATGEVKLINAEIGGHLGCAGGSFSNIRPRRNSQAAAGSESDILKADSHADESICADALKLRGSIIKGNLWLGAGNTAPHDKHVTIEGSLDLRDLQAGVLIDDTKSWPLETVQFQRRTLTCHIYLDGFSYGRIGGNSPVDLLSRKLWLKRQPAADFGVAFKAQAFEQLIRVLRDMGHTDDAHAIAIYKERCRWWRPLPGGLLRGWPWWVGPSNWVRLTFDVVAGYGYRAHRVVMVGIAVWFMCSLAYLAAHHNGLVQLVNTNMPQEKFSACKRTLADSTSSSDLDCPRFNAFKFSADVILPVMQLHEKTAWKFDPSEPKAGAAPSAGNFDLGLSDFIDLLRSAENVFGWIASVILAALLSRKINRE
jgi:hypothetical protein